MSIIDLNSPPPNHEYKVSVEREETSAERGVRLTKDLAVFALAFGFAIVIAWLCIDALRSESTTPDEKKWAMSVLSAAAGALVGYLVKK